MTDNEFERTVEQMLQMESNKEAFFRLCDIYLAASEKQRKELQQNVFYERDWEAPDTNALAAHLPGEPDRETRIRASLICMSFVANADFRDNLVTVAIIWNALKDCGKDADAWLRYFADISFGQGASAMDKFASRKAEDKELDVWGHKREITDLGIIYKNKYPVDLDRLLRM